MRLVTAAEMKAIDEQAVQHYGLSTLVLMENAGTRVVDAVNERYGPPAGLAILIVCGKGNNGGDGLVAARHLLNAGARVRVYLAGDPRAMTESARANYEIFRRIGGSIEAIPMPGTVASAQTKRRARASEPSQAWRERLANDLDQADVVIDALLGTGISGAVAAPLALVIDAINESGRPVVAVDIPSGIDADSGEICGTAVKAELTVTFGAPKPGLILHPGAGLAGDLVVADISLPGELLAPLPGGVELLTGDEVRDLLPRRAPTAHKGDAGRVAIVAGSRGFTGAATIAGQAAGRAGAGLVTVLAPASAQRILAGKLTEEMTIALAENEQGQLAETAAKDVLSFAERVDAVAAGPGLGVTGGVREIVERLLATAGAPLVLDADALNVLAGDPAGTALSLAAARRPLVLTPHPGEMARLTGATVEAIESDRIGAARELAKAAGCCIVLKGAPTVIASADGTVWLNPTGNPGMASGGMGDALTGVIAALIAQGLTPEDGARAGVFLHGLAGDIAAEEIGDIGYLAGDVVARLPAARQRVLAAPDAE